MKYRNTGFLIICAFVLLGSCSKKTVENNAGDISIFAAAGTRLASEEICYLFENKTKFNVQRNYASSGTLARQIANGADCDVYISANKQWIDFLAEKDFLKKDSIRKIAGNSIVVIAPADSKMDPMEFTKDFDVLSTIKSRVVIGDPGYVPVGKYAKQALSNAGWFGKLQDKMIMAKDVSAVLRYVELGECDWGIVYYTEAVKSLKIKVVQIVPSDLHKAIKFYAADIKNQIAHGHLLTKMFSSKDGQKILSRHGFKIEED